jgi:hypothetical protein
MKDCIGKKGYCIGGKGIWGKRAFVYIKRKEKIVCHEGLPLTFGS